MHHITTLRQLNGETSTLRQLLCFKLGSKKCIYVELTWEIVCVKESNLYHVTYMIDELSINIYHSKIILKIRLSIMQKNGLN